MKQNFVFFIIISVFMTTLLACTSTALEESADSQAFTYVRLDDSRYVADSQYINHFAQDCTPFIPLTEQELEHKLSQKVIDNVSNLYHDAVQAGADAEQEFLFIMLKKPSIPVDLTQIPDYDAIDNYPKNENSPIHDTENDREERQQLARAKLEAQLKAVIDAQACAIHACISLNGKYRESYPMNIFSCKMRLEDAQHVAGHPDIESFDFAEQNAPDP